MSAKAGTIQGTQTGVPAGAWIAGILLVAMIVVALFAVNNSSRTNQSAPITTTLENTVPVGFSHVAPTVGTIESTVPVGFSHVAPTAGTIESTVPVGFSHVAPTTGGEPWQPIIVNGSACHQCL